MKEQLPPNMSGQEIATQGARLERVRAYDQNELDTGGNGGYVQGYMYDTARIIDDRDDVMRAQKELVEQHAVDALASEFHEDWRKTRLDDQGNYEPRIKTTKDEKWIEEHGSSEVDIANTDYVDLPEDWQAENKAAAAVVVGILVENNGEVGLEGEQFYEVGEKIHSAWLDRNEWAKGGELDVPFHELSPEEQDKDISQIDVARRVFTPEA